MSISGSSHNALVVAFKFGVFFPLKLPRAFIFLGWLFHSDLMWWPPRVLPRGWVVKPLQCRWVGTTAPGVVDKSISIADTPSNMVLMVNRRWMAVNEATVSVMQFGCMCHRQDFAPFEFSAESCQIEYPWMQVLDSRYLSLSTRLHSTLPNISLLSPCFFYLSWLSSAWQYHQYLPRHSLTDWAQARKHASSLTLNVRIQRSHFTLQYVQHTYPASTPFLTMY